MFFWDLGRPPVSQFPHAVLIGTATLVSESTPFFNLNREPLLTAVCPGSAKRGIKNMDGVGKGWWMISDPRPHPFQAPEDVTPSRDIFWP